MFRNIGFDSIAIALLARANPFAVIPAAFLWGALLAGARVMQVEAGVAIDLVRIVQALMLLFVAADAIVRTCSSSASSGPPAAGALRQGLGHEHRDWRRRRPPAPSSRRRPRSCRAAGSAWS